MGTIQAVTELGSKVNGFIAGCGEASLLVILNAANGKGTSPQQVTALINQAVNAGQTTGQYAGSGQISPQGLSWLAQQNGVNLVQQNWQSALNNVSANNPVLLGVSNATAFGGADSNVYGHYITVVGKSSSGFIVSDPNTPQSQSGNFITYTLDQIRNANPFSAQTVQGGLQGVSMSGAGPGGKTQDCGPFPLLPIDWPSWLACQTANGISGATGWQTYPNQPSPTSGVTTDWMGQLQTLVAGLYASLKVGAENAGLLLIALVFVIFGFILVTYGPAQELSGEAMKVAPKIAEAAAL